MANGTAAVAAAVNAGCDQNDGVVYGQYLSSAVQDKLLTQDTVDRALSRVLHARFRVGAFDPPTRVPWTNLTQDVLASSAHRALALDAAQQSIVLLKNAGAVLPLQASKLKKIAVIGPAANNSQVRLLDDEGNCTFPRNLKKTVHSISSLSFIYFSLIHLHTNKPQGGYLTGTLKRKCRDAFP